MANSMEKQKNDQNQDWFEKFSVLAVCRKCMCSWNHYPCCLCVNNGYKCEGVCRCCSKNKPEEQRVLNHIMGASNVITKQANDVKPVVHASVLKRFNVPTSASPGSRRAQETCGGCNCTLTQSPCILCIHNGYACGGNCKCCELKRQVKIPNYTITQQLTPAPSTSRGVTQTVSVLEHPVMSPNEKQPNRSSETLIGRASTSRAGNYCNQCMCTFKDDCCTHCVRIQFKCRGTCSCCDLYREIEALKGANTNLQEPSSIYNQINSRQIAEPRTETIRDCDLCFCLKEDVTCEICEAQEFRCTGTCFCCRDFRSTRRKI